MNRPDLSALLRTLHAALAETPTLDDPTRALVADVRRDLERALAAPDPETHGTLATRLRASVQHFEADHPDLTALVQRVVDQLANLGV
jgi:hypothetical protein